MVAPLLLGSGKPALDLHPIGGPVGGASPRAPGPMSCPDGDVLFDCDMRSLAHEGAAA